MTRSLRRKEGMAPQAFLLSLAMAVLLFLPFVIYNHGYFIYYGDFNAQQIPFYMLAHDAVRSGNIGWSWLTDLGANFVGSYSFYLLGSPFFWLTLPFPTDWLPYMMAPLLALKIACCGLTAYLYAERFLRPQLAVTAGVLYAFSGFSMYNIFFNHFHEAMVWFPLLLLGIEQYMTEGRRGLFAVTVLMSALSNYYFFIGQALFVMLYWVMRATSGDWSHRCRRFFGLWLQAILGVLGAAVLLLPSFYAVIQNNRTGEYLQGWGLFIYSTSQRPYDILHSFFFPPELPARANFLLDSNNKWASMSLWIPVFGCTGAIAYFQSRRHTDWLRRMLILLFFCTMIPALNAMFQLFNQVYYARWFYMPVLMLILATLLCFEQESEPVNWSRAIGWSGGFTAAFALIGVVPKTWKPKEGETQKLGLERYPEWFWLYVGIAVCGLALTALLIHLWRRDRRQFAGCCCAVCVVVSLGFGWCYLTMGKSIAYYPDDYVIEKLIRGGDFSLPDSEDFCRVDMNKGMDNQGMYWQMPCIQAFHSIVPGSVMEFYPSVGVQRSVGSRPDSDHYALRSLLSVRWLFDYRPLPGDVKLSNKKEEDNFETDGVTAMPGWSYYDTQDGFAIYENQNYIGMGFTYPGYITRAEYNELSEENRELLLLKALVVEEDGDMPIPHLDTDAMYFSEYQFEQDCAERAVTAASSFTVDNDGFTAVTSLEQENYVFFSVPYEAGWSAEVNGQPAEIRQVNVGFMAVLCPAGANITIRFTYETPGLRVGASISAAGLLLLAVYLLCAIRPNRRIRDSRMNRLPEDRADRLPATEAAWEQPPAVPDALTPAPAPSDDGFDLYAIYRPADSDGQPAPEKTETGTEEEPK